MRRRIPLLLALAAALPLCQAQVLQPQITSINPSSIAAGSPTFNLVVAGYNFSSSSQVLWNSKALSNCVWSPGTTSISSITCPVPASLVATPGTASIQVANPYASSSTWTFTILAVPVITGINPTSVMAGSPGFTLVVYGQYFNSSSQVLWNTNTLPGCTFNANLNTLSCVISSLLVVSPGTVSIRVMNPPPTYYENPLYSNTVTFSILAGPTISAISPTTVTAGCTGVTLTIMGSGFLAGTEGASTVEWTSPFTGVRLLQPASASSTQLRVLIPDSFLANPATASIRVVNPGAVYSNAVDFVISLPPAITLLDPPVATAGGPEFTLTVTGSGFVPPGQMPGSAVQWIGPAGGTSELETQFVSTTVLRARVPATLIAKQGTAQVAVVNPPCAVRSNLAPFEIVAPLAITTTSLPTGSVNVAYSASLAATGGVQPYSWSLHGNLPAGLSFNASTAVITGTPTVAGFFNLSALVRDRFGATATATFTLTIVQVLSITTPSPLPNGVVGVAYSTRLAAVGGQPPYSWSVTAGKLPDGLSLNSSTGDITGTPTSPAVFEFTAQVMDSAKATATRVFTLWIGAALAITTASPLPSGVVGVAYSQTLAATGGIQPYSWSIADGTLPPGLSLNPATGAVTGSPTTAGTYNFTARVTDSGKNVTTKPFSLTVSAYDLAITTASPLPAGTVGIAYAATLAATGGRAPYRWSISAGVPPQGLSLNASTGVISGTPTAAGAANFAAEVTDANARTATKAFSVTIGPRPELRFSGLSDVVQPAQQPRLQVNLAAASTTAITGRLTLTFAHDAVVPLASNPEVQFSTGGTTVDFTIPAGETRAQFGTAQDVGIQVGTVAGTITVSASPVGGSVQTRIARAAPTISSVRVTRTATGFDVEIIGRATPRQVTSAAFRFTAPGVELQTPEVTVNVDSAFTTWYRDAASGAFGSQFRYVQPFTVTGEASAVNSVSVTLTNATGMSSATSANF